MIRMAAILVVVAVVLSSSSTALRLEEAYVGSTKKGVHIVFRATNAARSVTFKPESEELVLRTDFGKGVLGWDKIDSIEYTPIDATHGVMTFKFANRHRWIGKGRSLQLGLARSSTWNTLVRRFSGALSLTEA